MRKKTGGSPKAAAYGANSNSDLTMEYTREVQQQGSPSNMRNANQTRNYTEDSTLGVIDSKWCELKITGKNISRRRNHSSVVYAGKLYIYGGYEVNTGILDDFYAMQIDDAANYSWEVIWDATQAPLANYPGKREKHSAIVFENKMYILGGMMATLVNTNEMHAYDFARGEWTLINYEGQTALPPIDSHSAVLDTQNRRLIVFGGFLNEQNKAYSNLVWEYQFDTRRWSIMAPANSAAKVPHPRRSSSIALIGNTLYMFGGTNCDQKFNDFWTFDLQKLAWTELNSNGSIPESRYGHSLFDYGGRLFLFGGIHNVTHEKNDLLYFDFQRSEWRIVDFDTSHNTEDIEDLFYNLPETDSNADIKDGAKGSIQGKSPNILPDIYGVKQGSQSFRRVYKQTELVQDAVSARGNNTSKMSEAKASSNPSVNQLEEIRRRSEQSKKQNLLQEFEVHTEEDRERFKRANSPTTEAVKDKINSVGNPQKSKKYALKNLDKSKIMNSKVLEFQSNRIVGRRPCAREGHSIALINNYAAIFGGDRHLMAYNDIYLVDLEQALSQSSQNLTPSRRNIQSSAQPMILDEQQKALNK